MQKVYSRINWENDPSTNTAINEDNLNKMDYAINEIDDRVVQLAGYETRVAESEKNAKQSEVNAKVSEENALESELKAKEYMENAFSGTPEGYEALIEQVALLDIKESTDYNLPNSKQGGYRLQELVGNTEQKTLSGKNLYDKDAYPMTDGVYISKDNGSYYESANYKSTISYIPFDKYAGKVITLNNEPGGSAPGMAFYVDALGSTFISGTHTTPVTVPDGTKYMRFTTNIDATDIQIELGEVATDYEPYIGGVEMEQGNYNTNSSSLGTKVDSAECVRSRSAIPCNSGDSITFTLSRTYPMIRIAYFLDGVTVSMDNKADTDTATFTVPSGVNSFAFHVYDPNGLTPETVGRISLTVNGKPIYIRTKTVEMMQGYYTSTGAWANATTSICNKQSIPCKSDDQISFVFKKEVSVDFKFYTDNTVILSKTLVGSTVDFVAPADSTRFNFYIKNTDGSAITPSTVGKITLTINDNAIGVSTTPYVIPPSPNPYYPQVIENVFDCVEMIQGTYSNTTGVYAGNVERVCNKHKIPCKSGDVVNVKFEKAVNIYSRYYKEDTFITNYDGADNVTEYSFTIPSNATHFNFVVALYGGGNITQENVGKITLTVNGKYVGQIVERGKNLKDMSIFNTMVSNGVSNTYDGTTHTITINATSSGGSGRYKMISGLEVGKSYTVSFDIRGTNGRKVECGWNSNRVPITLSNEYKRYSTTIIATTTSEALTFYTYSSSTLASGEYMQFANVQIEEDTEATDYEPYTEKITTFFLNEPLRATDRIVRMDGVIKVERNKAGARLDNSYSYALSSVVGAFYLSIAKLPKTPKSWTRILSDKFQYATSLADTLYGVHIDNDSVRFKISDSEITLDDVTAFFDVHEYIDIEYFLNTSIYETLDTESQIALNSLETFDTVTYIEVDSKVKSSGISGKYGTSQVGALALENANLHDTVNLTTVKGSVANNLTTTEEGFVLDARQGHLIDSRLSALEMFADSPLIYDRQQFSVPINFISPYSVIDLTLGTTDYTTATHMVVNVKADIRNSYTGEKLTDVGIAQIDTITDDEGRYECYLLLNNLTDSSISHNTLITIEFVLAKNITKGE